ncbi:MAG: ribosomal protein S18-alanine N-acetyltransferase [Lachnospiraceae bacterium]|nr:ribosomal protein S18-alanine N-acetyltransferase [Lachnospiraceae bacterium]
MRELPEHLRIRQMEDGDLDQVTALEEKIFSIPWTRDGFYESLHSQYTLYLVAETEKIVGYCGYMRSFEDADICNVAVDPEMRCRGIGEAMLRRLMEEGRKDGIERYTLEVRVSNVSALRLYQKLGFEIVGKRKNFYALPTEDAYIMWTGEVE